MPSFCHVLVRVSLCIYNLAMELPNAVTVEDKLHVNRNFWINSPMIYAEVAIV